jgi:gamma-glutamyltranspeptidase/glutathione hydrolase
MTGNAPPRAARSKFGIVTSPHALATQRGADVLASGGNAVEAALATMACLCVTYPHVCGLGGDAFFVIADKAGNGKTVSGIG